MELSPKYDKYKKESEEFEGFPAKPATNYWPYPKALNGHWHRMNGSEQKVLDYILRHTWGYNKDRDAISLSQFKKGIRSRKTKKYIDRGTGLENDAIINAIKKLIKKKFIIAEKRKGKTTIYSLKIATR